MSQPQPDAGRDLRVQCDFLVEFANGGSLRGEGFRIDVADEPIGDEELADAIVRDLRLLMAERITIANQTLLNEPHKRNEPDAARRRGFVDVSHEIADGMVTYPGLPAPTIRDHLSRRQSREHYSPGTEFQIGRLEMVGNTGTYLDSPFHRYVGGLDLAGLPLASLADLPGLVVRVPAGTRAIPRSLVSGRDVGGRAVLFHTGWDARWGSDAYFDGHPFLTGEAARYLVRAKAALVGIDSMNVDDTEDLARPAHSELLAAEIPVLEHLCHLEALPATGFRFFALPAKVRGLGTFPVRAIALLET